MCGRGRLPPAGRESDYVSPRHSQERVALCWRKGREVKKERDKSDGKNETGATLRLNC